MFEVLSSALAGVLLGTLTGLTPGLHVNTIVVLILSFAALLLDYLTVKQVVALIVAMSVTHTFVGFIPAVLIGAPGEDNVLSVLPGHRLLREGRGYEAVRLTVLGGVGSIILGAALLPLALLMLPSLYATTREILPYLLLAVLAYMVCTEKSLKRRVFSLVLIAYAGLLGVVVLNHAMLPGKYVLFPTLTGLFGASTLLISLRSSSEIPEQKLGYEAKGYPFGVLAGSLGGILTGLLPGVGSSQSALIIQNLMKKQDEKSFLVALGGVNTSDSIYALLALYLISNPRSGASIAVERIMGELTYGDFLFMAAIVMFTAFFAAYVTLAKFFVLKVQRINYRSFSLSVLAFLVLLVSAFTGVIGLLIFATSTAIGVLAPLAGVKRSHCMAVLIIPTIMYYLHWV
jgi:putative membrane protein